MFPRILTPALTFAPVRTLALTLALTIALGLAAPRAAFAQSPGLDHAGLAARFLERHDVADASPATLDLHSLLEERYLHLRVGLFDLYTPADAGVEGLEDYARVVSALFAAQERWLEWLEPVLEDAREVRADQRTLSRWVGSWKMAALAEAASRGGGDLLELLEAKDDVREAAQRYADYLVSGAALGLDHEGGHSEPIVLIPDRGRFTEFLCFGGWLYDHLRPVFWQAGVEDWTHFYIDEFKVLAMQFAAPGRQPGDYQTGWRMDSRTETGLEQQIVQLAANSMLANYFGERVPPSLAGALAVNLVVDLYGECDTRVDGDLRARRTEAREIFVPGGNPDGGILPPNLADSRWRDRHGADRFVGALKRAMEERRRSEPVTFELLDDGERARRSVAAPFLGSSADRTPVGQEFFGDQLEFLRSYRTCFLYWLREEAGGSRGKSERAFASLLSELACNEDPEALEGVFERVYGDPLSAPVQALGKDQLEGRFLGWLEKRR